VLTSAEGETTVCFEEKMAMELLDVFHTRMKVTLTLTLTLDVFHTRMKVPSL
jgi:hypothetical protein